MPEWTNPPNVYTPQAHYSQVARIGNTLYISGQLGLDIDGELVGPGDARAQARRAWRNLEAILTYYDATPRQLVKTTTSTSPLSSLPIRSATFSSSAAAAYT